MGVLEGTDKEHVWEEDCISYVVLGLRVARGCGFHEKRAKNPAHHLR